MANKKTAPLKANQKEKQIPYFFERAQLTTKLEAMHSPASPMRRGFNKRFLLSFPEVNKEYYKLQYDEDLFNGYKDSHLVRCDYQCGAIEDSDGDSQG